MSTEPGGTPQDSPPPTDSDSESAEHTHHTHEHEEMVCYCFHVPLRKIENFIRRERPTKVSMISHCLGAGTGCGTCVYDLKDIYKRVMAECAAQDARNGVVATPGTPAAPYAPLPRITGNQPVPNTPRHSPAVDLGPVLAPTPVATPFRLEPGASAPKSPRPPAYPVSAESTEIELEEEPDENATEDTP